MGKVDPFAGARRDVLKTGESQEGPWLLTVLQHLTNEAPREDQPHGALSFRGSDPHGHNDGQRLRGRERLALRKHDDWVELRDQPQVDRRATDGLDGLTQIVRVQADIALGIRAEHRRVVRDDELAQLKVCRR